MAIIRGKRDVNFTVLRNDPLRDKRLSFKSRGIMSYMLSMPDDWKFYISELVKHSDHDGRDSVQSGLKELEGFGYLQRITKRNSKGRFDSVDYLLVDTPVSSPETGFPDTGKPDADNPEPDKPETENPPLLSTNSTKNLPVLNTDNTNDDDEGNTQPVDLIKKSWTQVWENEPNQVVGIKLREWSQTIGPDLVCYAINIAGEHSVTKSGALKYLEKLINGWQERKVATVEQAKKLAADREKKHKKSNKPQKHKSRKEVRPSWMNEDGTTRTGAKESMTPEQKQQLADRITGLGVGGAADA